MAGHCEDNMFTCIVCGRSGMSENEMKSHITEHEEDTVCPYCDQIWESVAGRDRHVNDEHRDFLTQSPSEHDGHTDRVMSDKQLAEEIHRREVEAANRDNKDFHSLQVKYGMDERTGYKQQYEQSLERAVRKGDISVVEYHSQKATMQSNDLSGVDDGHSCTKDLIQRLNHYHKYTPGFVMRAWLCSAVDHYSGSYGDKGWGCGYRNLQMLLSSLVQDPMYRRILFNDNPQIPSIPKIQSLIEVAWTEGFDRQGCEQLGGRVVNTRKWIGATEIVALLSAFKIKCKLLDFHSPSGKDGTHPKLFEWVKNYFENQDTFRLPLYLQHQGHSRTVIGVEEMKDKSLRLLLFDPSSSKRHMEQFYGKVTGYLMKSLRRTINGLRAKQYQIVAVTGVLTDQQYEEYKVLKSEKVS
ncbi:zinc finger-containing ubiquitin peptidase 1-like isoform X2 [Gigantopelta aegis]|uniref:zinc finger-containing ubiquitin peptidase 1-like isoform X2 n=1 Tax=Gigantopelta aegis TaxID=1735272 RepID=UPI001B88A7F3|nr:zinc finger-containing ubiquitin peptidase 1-like isoform X2 [Gigantopelta aegis]